MDEAEVIREFGHMWKENKANYVLEKSKHPSLHFPYTIMDRIYNGMVIIEVDEMATYVIDRMLENGVLVVDDFETVKNPNRPDPMFFSKEHEAQYREWEKTKKWKKKEE